MKNMTYVVTEACIKCKYTDCVSICPVDCFREGPNFLAIHPNECIDCGLCEPECPVDAIRHEDDLDSEQLHFKKINEKYASTWPTISVKKPAPEDADHWATVKQKLALLEE